MICLVLIYVISALLFLTILIFDIKKNNGEVSIKQMIEYYKFDVVWMFCPLINTLIVLMYVLILIKFNLFD